MLGDVQELPFPDGTFDAAVAAWMLYHVPDRDRAISELARVLRPGGRLVAITNGRDHLAELWHAVEHEGFETGFSGENGALSLNATLLAWRGTTFIRQPCSQIGPQRPRIWRRSFRDAAISRTAYPISASLSSLAGHQWSSSQISSVPVKQ